MEITKLPKKDKSAEGKIIEIIGYIDQAGVDMMSLIKEYDLPYEFPEPVLKEAKKINQEVDVKNIKNRRDLRDQEIFTIDGEDAKDLDDAVNVEKLENGNYQLGVHIADVSHYVKEGSFLDKEAILRGTSVYMLDRVIPMLPVELSNGICSLNAGKDRFAISCVMEINSKGQVVSSDIFKSVIKVTERMSYTSVQKILDDSDKEITKRYADYIEHFKRMEELAHILKNRRANKIRIVRIPAYYRYGRIFFITFSFVASIMAALRRFLFLFVVFFVRIWLLFALNLFSLPVPVTANRFAAAFFVLIFGIVIPP